jgi:hypothetical protein
LFIEMFGRCAEPPESLPLRLLGLGAMPSRQDRLKSAFRLYTGPTP